MSPEEGAHKQVLVGGTWLIAARALDRVMGIASISVLARLLKPVDFGLVAVAGTVVAAVELLSAFGFDWALVRHRDPSTDDLNTAWTLRVLFGVFTLVALTLLGPAAAAFYRLPALRAVLIAMGVSSLAGALENIGTVYFRREFAFHKEFLIRSAARIAGLVVTVALAWQYRSYWALIAGVFAGRCVAVAGSYLLHPYRPRLSLRNARELFGFSSWLLIGNVIEYGREKFADLFLGRVYGAGANGLFAVAGEISSVPISEVAAPINRAAYSKYAEDVRAGRALGPSYFSIASFIWMIALPMTAGTVAVAPEAVALLLGPRWQAASPVLQWLAVGTAFTAMAANTHYVYWALGHTRMVAGLSLAGVAMVIPLTILCSHLAGYVGVAVAFAISSAALVPVNFVFLRRAAEIRFRDLWHRVWRIVLATAVMSGVLWAGFSHVSAVDVASTALLLFAKILVGASTYMLMVMLAWFASGRPPGPEHAALELLQQVAKRCNIRLPAIFGVR
jgi:O-antigen/teichoic acid export membrane protein